MENVEKMETKIQDFYEGDANQCNFNHQSSDRESEETLPMSSYSEKNYNFPDAGSFIQQFLQDAEMDGNRDDIQTTNAVFEQLDILVREQVDSEIEMFKENISKILTDQQMYFKQAFGLQDQVITEEAMHVVPNTGQQIEEEIISASDESRHTTDQTDSGDSDECTDRLQWYEGITEYTPENESILKCLIRMLVADAAITTALRRKEYAS